MAASVVSPPPVETSSLTPPPPTRRARYNIVFGFYERARDVYTTPYRNSHPFAAPTDAAHHPLAPHITPAYTRKHPRTRHTDTLARIIIYTRIIAAEGFRRAHTRTPHTPCHVYSQRERGLGDFYPSPPPRQQSVHEGGGMVILYIYKARRRSGHCAHPCTGGGGGGGGGFPLVYARVLVCVCVRRAHRSARRVYINARVVPAKRCGVSPGNAFRKRFPSRVFDIHNVYIIHIHIYIYTYTYNTLCIYI